MRRQRCSEDSFFNSLASSTSSLASSRKIISPDGDRVRFSNEENDSAFWATGTVAENAVFPKVKGNAPSGLIKTPQEGPYWDHSNFMKNWMRCGQYSR